MNWLKEIKTVGLSDWLWFVLHLRRNVFHHSLDILKVVDGRYLIEERIIRRRRAHRIDVLIRVN